ncbi:MAG TPA: FxsA family protein [Desulfohalobiaceae bacterium]|nr:FxsA family protein [Desulfohalobiaceae bacterium]
MLIKLVLAFTLIPIAEIYLLIKLGGAIGAINTILVVIVTALAGAYLARLEGLKTMMQIRGHLEQGLMPTEEMFDALLIFIAGIVLMTPGFLTDIAGLLVLIPGSRRHIKSWIKSKTSHITHEKLHTIE